MSAIAQHALPSAPRRRRRPAAQLLFRSAAAHVAGFATGVAPQHAAIRLFGGDAGLRAVLDLQLKAGVEPALTTVPEWAGNLVRTTYAEFLDLLRPVSVFAQLSALGAHFDFTVAGKVSIPGRDATSSLAGDFVGENAPIPVKAGALRAVALTPKKLAVLSALSNETASGSGGALEQFIRDCMIEDTSRLLDTRLMDAVSANAIRPAGLLNGVTLTPSSGVTPADVVADLRAAVGPIIAAGGGRKLVWLVNPEQALSLLMQGHAPSGTFADGFLLGSVIVSPNVPSGTLIVLDAAEFASVADAVPTFVVSESGTLHMDDDPLSINPAGTMVSPVISLYQQDAIALRAIQQINWAMRRPDMVAGVSGIAW